MQIFSEECDTKKNNGGALYGENTVIHLGTKQFLNMLSTFFGKILSHFSARTAELAEGDENNLSQKIQRRLVQIERVEDAASFARCAKFLFNHTSVDSLRLSFYFAPIQLILLSCSSS